MKRIYTDGSCRGTPGPGGYAAIVVIDDNIVDVLTGYSPSTTNNIMELLGIRTALVYCIENNVLECRIYSDSEYSVKGINDWMRKWEKKNWKGSNGKTIKNLDIWIEINALWREATQKLNISIHWVKGHADNKFNNIADEKAKEIIDINYAKNNNK